MFGKPGLRSLDSRGSIPIRTNSHVKEPRPDPVLNFCHRILELLCYGLAFQRVNGVRLGLSGRDDKCDDGNRGT